MCKKIGKCTAKLISGEDGEEDFMFCEATSDSDCQKSEFCKTKKKCKLLDGSCSNPKNLSSYRQESIKKKRPFLYKLTAACENEKARAIKTLQNAKGIDSRSPWESPELLSPDLYAMVSKHKAQIKNDFNVVLKLIENDKDLFGKECANSLKTAVEKALNNCINNSRTQNIEWILDVGKQECGI